MARFHFIPSNPSCHQIEDLNAKLHRIPTNEPIVISLARRTGAKFFVESSIAQLITHLSLRLGRLVIRDTYHSFEPPYDERFLSKIDGVSALVYSHLNDSIRIEDTKKNLAPISLFDSLKSRQLKSGLLEKAGPTRTLIAIDPIYPNPAELGSTQVRKNDFHTIVRKMLTQYENRDKEKTKQRRHAENQLINFLYETFQNTVEHGRYTENNELIPGIRYFRIHVYSGNNVSKLVDRATGFPELKQFLKQTRHKSSEKRFVELSVADAGQGITSHYLNSRPKSAPSKGSRMQVLQALIGGRLSSKRYMSGVGLGLPNALSALRELKAFISLRTEEFWLYRDYTSKYSSQDDVPYPDQCLYPVENVDSIAPVTGTQFNVLIDFPL